MTMIDDRPGTDHEDVDRPEADRPEAGNTVLQPDGAYCTDVLRVVRGTPNAEELAALVTALLLTRRAHEENHLRAPQAQQAPQGRPAWPWDRYAAPGSWMAGS
ncbi:MAG TPA: hypothetical protein VFU65_07095 [Actinocrinis sp.]|nr:hypothetical protein [Actinocrinis sp.]